MPLSDVSRSSQTPIALDASSLVEGALVQPDGPRVTVYHDENGQPVFAAIHSPRLIVTDIGSL